MSSSGGTFYWNIRFIRPVQDWELESVASFMDHISISAVSLRRNEVDKMHWKLSPRGVLMFALITRLYNLQSPVLSHGNLCANHRCLLRLGFIFGQQRYKKF